MRSAYSPAYSTQGKTGHLLLVVSAVLNLLKHTGQSRVMPINRPLHKH